MDPLAIAAASPKGMEYDQLQQIEDAIPLTSDITVTFTIDGSTYETTFKSSPCGSKTVRKKHDAYCITNGTIDIAFHPVTGQWKSDLKKNSPTIRAFRPITSAAGAGAGAGARSRVPAGGAGAPSAAASAARSRVPAASAARSRAPAASAARSRAPASAAGAASASAVARTGSLDILQILATKIQLCMPGVNPSAIYLQDAAKLAEGHSKLSDFKIMRGMTPTYVKYGFFPRESEIWAGIIKFANHEGSWVMLQEHAPEGFETYESIATLSGSIKEGSTIVDIMKTIPYESDLGYSDHLVQLIHSSLYTRGPSPDFDIFVFIPTSPEWDASKRRLIIRDVVVVSTKGSRVPGASIKTKRYRSSRRKN